MEPRFTVITDLMHTLSGALIQENLPALMFVGLCVGYGLYCIIDHRRRNGRKEPKSVTNLFLNDDELMLIKQHGREYPNEPLFTDVRVEGSSWWMFHKDNGSLTDDQYLLHNQEAANESLNRKPANRVLKIEDRLGQ